MSETPRVRFSKEVRRKVHEKCNGHCAYCGQKITMSQMQIDHVHSLRKGGSNEMDNLLPSCRSCNFMKSTSTLEDFRKHIQRLPDILRRDSVTYKNAERFRIVEVSDKPIKFYFEHLYR